MYRAVAWKARHDGVDLSDDPTRSRASRSRRRSISTGASSSTATTSRAAIRTPEMDRAAAVVARHAPVRAALVARQRAYGEGGGIVMEGRDIGTVVFPHADVKIYLDASPEERARRRAADPAHAAGRSTPASSRWRRRSRRATCPTARAPSRRSRAPLMRSTSTRPASLWRTSSNRRSSIAIVEISARKSAE